MVLQEKFGWLKGGLSKKLKIMRKRKSKLSKAIQ